MKDMLLQAIYLQGENPHLFMEPHLPRDEYNQARDLLNQLGFNANINSHIPDKNILIRCPASHPVLHRIFEMIRNTGMEISQAFVPREDWGKRIRPRILREYDDAELDSFEFLVMASEWYPYSITNPCPGSRDGHLIGRIERVGTESEEGWDQLFGCIRGGDCVVHPTVRDAFVQAGLKIDYQPVHWDEPELAEHDYWEIAPTVRMPPCLVPVVNHEVRLAFDDGPIEPVELRYRSTDVRALGEFDAALTLENTPTIPVSMEAEHKLVVSQRVRQMCKKLGLPVRFIPVRLDAPPPELPWFFTSDSPPANA